MVLFYENTKGGKEHLFLGLKDNMKNKRLTELIDDLLGKVIKGEEKAFHYELCPYFSDCSRKVEKRCLADYKSCSHYIHRKKINLIN